MDTFMLMSFDVTQFRKANQTKQCISVPGHLLPYLIGTGGERIRQFEKKHLVKVTFSDDQARVVGPSKNVNEAIEELCQVSRITPGLSQQSTPFQ
jgi:hypothetical protein